MGIYLKYTLYQPTKQTNKTLERQTLGRVNIMRERERERQIHEPISADHINISFCLLYSFYLFLYTYFIIKGKGKGREDRPTLYASFHAHKKYSH